MKIVTGLAAAGLLAARVAAASLHPSPAPERAAFGEPGRPGAATRTVAIAATGMAFRPNHILVAQGETIRFVVTNHGAVRHEFVLGDAAFQQQHRREMARMPDMRMDEANALDLAPGQTKILQWHFTRAGTLGFACDLPGHADAGMTGTLQVAAARATLSAANGRRHVPSAREADRG